MTNHNNNTTIDGISVTTKELNEWCNAGLIDAALLAPEKTQELLRYISKNKEFLYKHFRDSELENAPNFVILPPPEKWPETYELHVIDKKTGKTVSTLDQVAQLKLVDDIYLKVKASELAAWQRETADIKNLTKDQTEDFKKFIVQIGSSKPLTRKEIATFIQEIQKEKHKPQKYRQSGHLIDQKLKFSKTGTSNVQIEREEIKRKIEDSHVEIKAEGIRLTEPESKLEHALTKLLRDNSQNKNPQEKDYYFGNGDYSIIEYGGKDRRAPVIRFKRTDLYKAYLCKDNYSGADAEYIDNLLIQYASKMFLIKYDHIKKVTNGNSSENLTDRIEEFTALIKIIFFFPNLTEEEKKKLDKGDIKLREKKEEVIIAFNPIFIDQINSKFVEFPDDTNRRLMIAAGGWNKVTTAMRRLMEWSLRDISAGREKQEINEENLVPLLGLEKYVKQNRIKLLNERIKKTIETIKAMGIIVKVEKISNTKGKAKWVFSYNIKYE